MTQGTEAIFDAVNGDELSRYYNDFRVRDRILLTGHSHQAWPDCAKEGLLECWQDASLHVDDKWSRAFEKAREVENGFARLLGEGDANSQDRGWYTLGASTHDLLVRYLSALPLRRGSRILATDCEFYSLRRQLQRLQEEGIVLEWVDAAPAATVGVRMAELLTRDTAVVFVSAVFFNTGHIAGELPELVARGRELGVPVVIDTYHALNAIPFSIEKMKSAVVVGGGYKYCQLGEGNCFIRVPAGQELRPVITGWMADFGSLGTEVKIDSAPKVSYERGGGQLAGATYDPVSHYRAARVFKFFDENNLGVKRLRARSLQQIGLMEEYFDKNIAVLKSRAAQAVSRNTDLPKEHRGGFLTLRTPHARHLCESLKSHGIYTDYRGNRLRLGPAPYVTDGQITQAMEHLRGILA